MNRFFIALAFLAFTAASAVAGTPTQYYVDTVNGNNGNAGTSIGAAWATLKYAIETGITPDTTNGDQINIYAPSGTPDNYTTGDPAITMSSYATDATATAPLIIRGVAADGSTPAIAYITCASRYLVNDTVFDHSRWINISVVGGSATGLWQMDRSTLVLGCLFDNTAGGNALEIDGAGSSYVMHSDIQGSSGNAYLVSMSGAGYLIGNYIHEQTNSCRGLTSGQIVIGNIFHMNTTNAYGQAINNSNSSYITGNICLNNAAGVSAGITCTGAGSVITNNYVEGWSGVGGAAITASSSNTFIVAANRYYNCTAGVTVNDTDYSTDNSVTTASGVANRASNDYTPTAELKAIGIPLTIGGETTYINVGAIQTGGASNVIDPLTGTIPGL